MISKNKIKYIQSLHRKKHRDQEGVFLAEGDKLVKEALQSGFKLRSLCATSDFIEEHRLRSDGSYELQEVSAEELKKISALQSPQRALVVVEMPSPTVDPLHLDLSEDLILALDGIQDPGNMGTIIRSADWFGVKSIYCSSDTVDCYNPKVVQASMGSIFRVKVRYVSMLALLERAKRENIISYGTFLDGESLYENQLAQRALLVMGNEGSGIRAHAETHLVHRIRIPAYSSSGSESLNVSIATSICLAEFRRAHKFQ